MRLGILSDTHGHLDPNVSPVFEDVDRILHAGDIGKQEVIAELEKLAPVTAVAGNVDVAPLAAKYAMVELVELRSRCVLLTHVRPRPTALARLAKGRRPDVVVFGHSHRPEVERDDGILFLNPGSAGPKRFRLPRTAACLDLGDELRPQVVDLETGQILP